MIKVRINKKYRGKVWICFSKNEEDEFLSIKVENLFKTNPKKIVILSVEKYECLELTILNFVISFYIS